MVKRGRIFLVGATGTIGRATLRALVARGHEVVCFVRRRSTTTGASAIPAVAIRFGDVSDLDSLRRDGFRGEHFDAVVSCMASRSGTPRDAWAVDHHAHLQLLSAAKESGVPRMVLLSAICVQKPLLEFQRAKLAFETALMGSGLRWSIVRPTAFFKSLSGQVRRVQEGKPFLVFGDGQLTACKPIGDDDLGAFIASCVDDPAREHRISPVGGPGDALTPRQQGELLFAQVGRSPRFTQVPVAMLDGVIAVLSGLGRIAPPLIDKAELARIGRYYATESMLVWDATAQRYDASATPSYGTETLANHYAKMLRGEIRDDRGAHAVF